MSDTELEALEARIFGKLKSLPVSEQACWLSNWFAHRRRIPPENFILRVDHPKTPRVRD